ncbi:MAG TPA: sporulation protein YpjB [Bacilli bacterium]|nr:sporulation protein YpjB [Bacilli bacterium]
MRRYSWILALVLTLMMWVTVTPVQAAPLVNPITLYQESVKVENMIRGGEKPETVLASLEHLSDMYTRLDQSKVSQRVEGMQAVASELMALKQMYAALKGPEQAVAEYRIHRLTVAFDSLAYPNSPTWLPIARSMENNLEKVIQAVAKQDQKAARTVFQKVRQERDQIWLALSLHGSPSELNLQQTAHRFIEGQLAGEKITDKQGTLDALGQYKSSIGHLAASIKVVKDPPLLPVVHLELDPLTYGSAAAVLAGVVGWRVLRKKKN